MRWYLDGYSLERQNFRLFKLTRMHEITLSDTEFAPREYRFDAKIQSNFQDKNIVAVTVRAKADAVERLEELFGAEIFTAVDEAWHIAQISLTDDVRGYRFLLSFGTNCVCIAPENVRVNIAYYLKEVSELYQSNSYLLK